MKKIFSILISFTLLFLFTFETLASNETVKPTKYSSVEYFEDGSCIETEITEGFSSASAIETRTTKLGTKRLTYKNSDGDIEWTADLTGTFVYDEYSCTCTSASITYSIVNTKWKIPSAVATKLGNKAFGDLTAKYYFLGVNTKTVEKSIVLTCSRFGELS